METPDKTPDKITVPAAPAETPPEAPAVAVEPRRYVTFAIASILVTVAAWITANWSGFVALALSVGAITLGALALGSRRHGVRNTAITAIIASAVLLVVLAAFMIVIYLGLKS